MRNADGKPSAAKARSVISGSPNVRRVRRAGDGRAFGIGDLSERDACDSLA